jgi:hypothetical protein
MKNIIIIILLINMCIGFNCGNEKKRKNLECGNVHAGTRGLSFAPSGETPYKSLSELYRTTIDVYNVYFVNPQKRQILYTGFGQI